MTSTTQSHSVQAWKKACLHLILLHVEWDSCDPGDQPKQKRTADSQETFPSEYLIHNLTVNSHAAGVAAGKMNYIAVCYIESTWIVSAFYLSDSVSL